MTAPPHAPEDRLPDPAPGSRPRPSTGRLVALLAAALPVWTGLGAATSWAAPHLPGLRDGAGPLVWLVGVTVTLAFAVTGLGAGLLVAALGRVGDGRLWQVDVADSWSAGAAIFLFAIILPGAGTGVGQALADLAAGTGGGHAVILGLAWFVALGALAVGLARWRATGQKGERMPST